MKVTQTKNWKLYWGRSPLPDGAETLGLVTPKNRPTGVLIRLVDGKYIQGNAGEIRTLPQRSVEKAIAAAAAAAVLASIPGNRKPRRKRLRP